MHTLRSLVHEIDPVTTPSSASVYEAAVAMSRGRVGAIAVVDDEALVGVFTERDLMTRVIVAGRDPKQTRVAEVMTHEVVTASTDDRVDACLETMRGAGCRHLLVVHDGRLVAMLSMRDLLRGEIEERTREISELRSHLPPPP
jgi:CBS domain-containing protein